MKASGVFVREEVEDFSRLESALDSGPEIGREQIAVGAKKGASKPIAGNEKGREFLRKYIVLADVEPGLGCHLVFRRASRRQASYGAIGEQA